MSLPFAQLAGKRAEQFEDAELTEEAFRRCNSWSMLSADKLVSLDEVAWVVALLVKGLKASGMEIQRTETVNENGARVVGVVASDSVRMKDGAA